MTSGTCGTLEIEADNSATSNRTLLRVLLQLRSAYPIAAGLPVLFVRRLVSQIRCCQPLRCAVINIPGTNAVRMVDTIRLRSRRRAEVTLRVPLPRVHSSPWNHLEGTECIGESRSSTRTPHPHPLCLCRTCRGFLQLVHGPRLLHVHQLVETFRVATDNYCLYAGVQESSITKSWSFLQRGL